ncbi:MAG: molybdenum cofactor guanylyltransferase MobA [Halocynthiibacter sp.]
MTRPLGVILAGGLSSRMGGGDKSLLPLGSQTVLGHVVARIAPQTSGLAINANGDAARFSEHDLPVLPDSIDGFVGPLAGVLAGLDWAAEKGADHIVTVAADTPFFPLNLVSELERKAQDTGASIVLAATQEGARMYRHPTFGLWSVALRNDLRSALLDGLRKVVLWTDQHGGQEVIFSHENADPFFNINTPDDLLLARQRIEA